MQKLKINPLFIISLVLTFIFSFFVVSAGVSFARQDGESDQAQQKIQGASQDKADEINNQDATENDNNENYNEASSSVGEDQGQEGKDNEIDADEHRSAVSNFVHGLLDVADREGGIGKQVRNIAREQDQSASTTVEAVKKVQSRSKWQTFLFGSDYKNLGTLRSEIVQTKNRLDQLDKLIENAQTTVDKTELQNQAKTLEQEQQKIETFVNANENKFSLLGWFVKLFSK